MAASEASIITAAPSLIVEALPAVTVPFGSNAGRSFASASILLSTLIPSS